MINLLLICLPSLSVKEFFENQSISGEDMNNSLVSYFLTHGDIYL